jgi:iron complex outermembrane receptor protein
MVRIAIVGTVLVADVDAARAQRPAQAPDPMVMDLDQLGRLEVDRVEGASKFLQEVTKAPASITIIKAKEIQDYGYSTLADILRSARGFYVSYDRTYEYVGVRGFSRPGDYNTRVLLMVDGHRINDALYDQASVGTELPFDVSLIDRVEIIRGPGSSLYGTSAFLAVVNVITKTAGELKAVEAEVEVGSLGTTRGRMTLAHRTAGGVGVILSASAYRSQQQAHLYFPEFDSPETNGGYADDLDADEYKRLFGSVSVGGLTLQGVYGARTKNIPTASYGSIFNDPQTFTKDLRTYFNASYGRSIGSGQLLVRSFADRYDYAGDYPYVFDGRSGRDVEKDSGNARWWGGEVTVRHPIGIRQTVVSGGEFRRVWRLDQSAFLETDGRVVLDVRRTSWNGALYVQDDVRVTKHVDVSIGVRRDEGRDSAGATSARAAVIYSPWEPTTFKALFGGAFRAPNAYETYYHSGPDRTLKAERIETSELVYEQYYGTHFQASASVFHNRIRDLITQRDVAEGDYLGVAFGNSGVTTANGVEIEASGTWGDVFSVRASQAAQRAEDDGSRTWLTNSPRHLLKINSRWTAIPKRMVLAYEGQYMSERLTLAGSVAPSHYLQNATLSWKGPLKGVVLAAGVTNLGGVQFADPSSGELTQDTIGQNGRTFWARARLSF